MVETLNDVFMKAMEMIVSLSPIGVFCLICPVVAEKGPTVLGSLAKVLLIAYLGYVLHAVIVYSLAVKLGAGMVMLAMVLSSVGLPVEGITLVAGVDRIFDMGRTTVNITGDVSCAIIVSASEEKKR